MKGNIWENRNRCTLRVEFGEATRRKAPPSRKDLQAILGEKKINNNKSVHGPTL